MVSILVTAGLTPKSPELKHTIIAVAFLINANVEGHMSDHLADNVVAKTMGKIGGLVEKRSTTADFFANVAAEQIANRGKDRLILR
ncbi:hypothetical protein H2248_008919 [Termitomyces sp. 'cryptogamus']|nr:hypothetical protein H2248_008919 [Termitomyces sp. 'cryptogamus']